MDMVNNVSNQANLNYKGMIGEALVDSTVYYQHTNHLMDIIGSERSGTMPMYTRSDEAGYNSKASFDLDKKNFLTLGSEFSHYKLNDWWPPITPMPMMMGPGTFESIKNGTKDRLAFFAEVESTWSKSWTTNAGLRTDLVRMDTGNVKGYNTNDNLPADAKDFNERNHAKTDNNLDAHLLSKYVAAKWFDIEMGLGRKTRSPNLYERYAWAGTVTNPSTSSSAGMDARMINWFGDGNGYVGNLSLKPEVAHKISTSFIAHDEEKREWEVRVTPYYTKVQNYIDANYLGTSDDRKYFRFANHDAYLYGSDLSAHKSLVRNSAAGDFSLRVLASYVKGRRTDGKANLYHMMPLNGKVVLQHVYKKWTSEFATNLVAKKEKVNELRNEPKTTGYALFDFLTHYQVTSLVKIDFGVTNILDLKYKQPLGGIDIVNNASGTYNALSGMGRSFNTALTVDFF